MSVVEKFDDADFVTHANYLAFVKDLSKNLSLSFNQNIKSGVALDKRVTRKVQLIRLTKANILEEYRNIQSYPEYAAVCVSWIPVKAYYLFYNLVTLLEYLITLNPAILSAKHSDAHQLLKRLIQSNVLVFSEDKLNKIFPVSQVEAWRVPQWENVKSTNFDPMIRYKQILKKLASYKKEHFKWGNKIKRLSGQKKQQFLQMKITMSDYFFWYRIKVNYRDLEFIDKSISDQNFVNFYNDYCFFANHFYRALKDCINEISMLRLQRKLL